MILDLLDAELRRDEGVRHTRYKDSRGFWTNGVGHNLDIDPVCSAWPDPWSDDRVDNVLNHDILTAGAALDLHCQWWRQMDEVRQRVIINMCFNMGIEKLMGFIHTLHAMQTGDYHGAAAGMAASAWAGEVGNRATRLISAMNTGVMPDEPV